jgi:choline dehydrogenase-like flavoprotein
MDTRHDFLIIGSGAGGCAAAYRLAREGHRVLLLERGEALPEDGTTLDPAIVLGEGRFKSREEWLDRQGAKLVPEECFNVGGKTRWYGAALARFGANEFDADAERGFLPWPVDASDLAPYYDQAEALLGVNEFAAEPDLKRITGRLTANGSRWRAEPLKLGLSRQIMFDPSQAVRFDGFALLGGMKADADSRLLQRVIDGGKLTVCTGAQVVELIGDPADSKRILGVRCADGRHFGAAHVLLAAGALHSPRLLQNYLYRSGIAPRTPITAHVGGNYKRHVLTAVLGFAPTRQLDKLRKTLLLTHPEFPHSSVQPLGGWIDREIVLSTMPRWLPRFVKRFFAERVYGFFLQTEDGSHPDNRVFAGADNEPSLLDYDGARLPHAEAEHRGFVRAFRNALIRTGMLAFSQRIGLAGSAHSVGTLVAGDNPRNSVVDAEGRVHGFENLYVVDGSVLPRVGRLNPALTIYAWSLRVAERLATRVAA